MAAPAPARAGCDEFTTRAFAMRSAATAMLGALALLPAAHAESRGELLYATHCIACHTADVHWRDQRVATDWPTLMAQVRRWQGVASLAWTERDILEVARYLNESVYHFPQTADARTSSTALPGAGTEPVLSRLWASLRGR